MRSDVPRPDNRRSGRRRTYGFRPTIPHQRAPARARAAPRPGPSHAQWGHYTEEPPKATCKPPGTRRPRTSEQSRRHVIVWLPPGNAGAFAGRASGGDPDRPGAGRRRRRDLAGSTGDRAVWPSYDLGPNVVITARGISCSGDSPGPDPSGHGDPRDEDADVEIHGPAMLVAVALLCLIAAGARYFLPEPPPPRHPEGARLRVPIQVGIVTEVGFSHQTPPPWPTGNCFGLSPHPAGQSEAPTWGITSPTCISRTSRRS